MALQMFPFLSILRPTGVEHDSTKKTALVLVGYRPLLRAPLLFDEWASAESCSPESAFVPTWSKVSQEIIARRQECWRMCKCGTEACSFLRAITSSGAAACLVGCRPARFVYSAARSLLGQRVTRQFFPRQDQIVPPAQMRELYMLLPFDCTCFAACRCQSNDLFCAGLDERSKQRPRVLKPQPQLSLKELSQNFCRAVRLFYGHRASEVPHTFIEQVCIRLAHRRVLAC